jgi:hypothetical protein
MNQAEENLCTKGDHGHPIHTGPYEFVPTTPEKYLVGGGSVSGVVNIPSLNGQTTTVHNGATCCPDVTGNMCSAVWSCVSTICQATPLVSNAFTYGQFTLDLLNNGGSSGCACYKTGDVWGQDMIVTHSPGGYPMCMNPPVPCPQAPPDRSYCSIGSTRSAVYALQHTNVVDKAADITCRNYGGGPIGFGKQCKAGADGSYLSCESFETDDSCLARTCASYCGVPQPPVETCPGPAGCTPIPQ